MWTRPNVTSPYIFVIGFNKSGTTSLFHFFKSNGIAAIKHDKGRLPTTILKNALKNRRLLKGYDKTYRVFLDLGFFLPSLHFEANQLFRMLDRNYPNALFIYNMRPMEAWLESRINHRAWDGTLLDKSEAFYNTNDPQIIKAIWQAQRLRFEDDLRSYFGDSDRLLEINIESADVPQAISNFTGLVLDPTKWGHHRKTKA